MLRWGTQCDVTFRYHAPIEDTCHPCQSKNFACHIPILWSRKQTNAWRAHPEYPNQYCETIHQNTTHSYLPNSVILFSTKYPRLNLQKRLSHVLVSKFGIRRRMNLKDQKVSLKKQMKMYLFKILGNEDYYLDVENISFKLKDCTLKTNWSNYISILFSFILHWHTTIYVLTSMFLFII